MLQRLVRSQSAPPQYRMTNDLIHKLLSALEKKPDRAAIERIRKGIAASNATDLVKSVLYSAVDDYIAHNPNLK